MLHNFFLSTAVAGGTCSRQKFRFTPSERLRLVRRRRRQVYDHAIRKSLTFYIQRLHRKECRQWKVLLLRKYLAHPAHWKELQSMCSYTSRRLHQHPLLDGLATMLVHWNPRNAFATKSFDRGTLDIARTHGSS